MCNKFFSVLSRNDAKVYIIGGQKCRCKKFHNRADAESFVEANLPGGGERFTSSLDFEPTPTPLLRFVSEELVVSYSSLI